MSDRASMTPPDLTQRQTVYSATARFAADGSPLPLDEGELLTLERLHVDSGPVGWTTAGMAVCKRCSYPQWERQIYWPCETARLVATIRSLQRG